jgi:hypothetical protein
MTGLATRFLAPGRWLIVLLTVAATAATTAAQITSTWNGSTGNWTDAPSHWSTANYPDNGNGGVNYNAVVNSGTVTLNQNITVTGFTMARGASSRPARAGRLPCRSAGR